MADSDSKKDTESADKMGAVADNEEKFELQSSLDSGKNTNSGNNFIYVKIVKTLLALNYCDSIDLLFF